MTQFVSHNEKPKPHALCPQGSVVTSWPPAFPALKEEESSEGKPSLDSVTGAYSFQNVNFAYEADHPVLEGFNLEVKPGETVALVGESGVGKTTVINMVIGYHFPGEGVMTIDGQDMRDIRLLSRAFYL